MPINADYFYQKAEQEFLAAQTTDEKVEKLQKMISASPKHKGSENLRAELNKRLVKLKKESEKEKKKKSGKSTGIKKEGNAQVTIFGNTQTGKSTLLASLTNARPKISGLPFTTTSPEIGTLDLEGIKVQLIELPSRLDDTELIGIARSSNLIVVLINSFSELVEMTNILKGHNVLTQKIFVLNKADSLSYDELKKFERLPIIKISSGTGHNLDELKKKIFESLDLMRIYTKEPGKKPSMIPVVIKRGSSIKELAGKIRKDFPERFLKARIWGTSAKFDDQIVGMAHILHDKDIVELYLKW